MDSLDTNAVNPNQEGINTPSGQKELRHLSAVVEFSDDAIISKDLNGIITSWNPGAERIFGYTEAEAIGKPVAMLIPADHQNEEPRILQRLRNGERIDHYETIRRRKDGTLLNISLTVSPIKDPSGNVVGASKIARDITDQVRINAQLAESLAREQAASRAKDDFIAMLSHELRTPLNPIMLLASDSARNPEIPDWLRAQFESILKNVQLEARLIDDLLDLNRVTRGKLQLVKQTLDLHTLLRSALQTLEGDIQSRRIETKWHLTDERAYVEADPVRLQQVFMNIISNAVKFTPVGGVISIVSERIGEDIVVKVSDNGIGMAADDVKRVFAPFVQGKQLRHYGGLGLGLAIARSLVETHAGRIEATSEGPGKGSTFSIYLPVVSQENVTLPSKKSERAMLSHGGKSRGCILLVDDHESTRTALSFLLGRRGYEVLAAATVAEAQCLAEKEPIDYLVSDIGLPDGNGYDLMRALGKKQPLKGIALTGYGMEEDINKAYAAGFLACLIKPINIDSLQQVLSSHPVL